MTGYDFTWKIMMLGDADSGKVSLTIRYISGFFLDDLKLTIGVDFYSKTTNFNDKKVKLQIWDFGGEERFRFLLHQYCKGANAAFFLYNITNPNSLDGISDWLQIIREHAGDIPIMLIGTHVDLQEFRAVSRDEGILAARKYNLSSFIELSAKTGQNVEKAFDVMTEILFERYRASNQLPMLEDSKCNSYDLKDAISIKDIIRTIFNRIKLFLRSLEGWFAKKIKELLKRMGQYSNQTG